MDKSIVRTLDLYRRKKDDEIRAEYLARGLKLSDYDVLCETLLNLRLKEKTGEEERDYATVMNWMMSEARCRIVLKHCLRYKQALLRGSKRVKSKNREVYLDTIGQYLSYVEGLDQ